MASTVRFLREYLRPSTATVVERDDVYMRRAEELPASVYRPAHGAAPLPGWVVLHGLTQPGRHHPALRRFVRALAAAGNVVFVPEVPEWQDLRVAPAIAISTIRDSVRALHARADVLPDHVGILGFSFGATQALIAAADADTARLIRGIAAWGGYCEIERVFRFAMTGLHEIGGITYQTAPDPYGSWIMAGNYLPHVPGCEDSAPVASALHALAIESGKRGIYAWDPVYDASKIRLRVGMTPAQRDLFDLFAPLTTAGTQPDTGRRLELAAAIHATAVRLDPLLDPRPFLPAVRVPVLLAHGRDDRLIPFTESMRLSRALSPPTVRSLTITALFQHSGSTDSGLGPAGTAREALRFLVLLRRLLGLV